MKMKMSTCLTFNWSKVKSDVTKYYNEISSGKCSKDVIKKCKKMKLHESQMKTMQSKSRMVNAHEVINNEICYETLQYKNSASCIMHLTTRYTIITASMCKHRVSQNKYVKRVHSMYLP